VTFLHPIQELYPVWPTDECSKTTIFGNLHLSPVKPGLTIFKFLIIVALRGGIKLFLKENKLMLFEVVMPG